VLIPSATDRGNDSGRREATFEQVMPMVKEKMLQVTVAARIRRKSQAFVGIIGGNMPTNANLRHGCG